MLVTGVNLTPVANAAETAYNPDAPAVQVTSGVTVKVYKDKNHTQPYDPNQPAAIGQTFYGQISFDFSDAEKPTLDSPTRSYKFPDNINVKDVKSSTLYDGDGNVAGTWSINNGEVTATWNEDWLTQHPSNITSFVSFDFTLNEDAGGNDNKEHITFPGGGGDITITIDKSKVSGQKDYELNDDGTVTFTVTLKPQFAVQNMVVTDTMGSNFTFVDGSFQLDGKPVNAAVSGQKATITLGDLAKADKDGYQLTYKAQLTDVAKKVLAQGGKLDDAQNTAQWNWNGADKPGEADVTPNFSYKMVQKSNGSGTASDIKWTVKLNTGSLKADMGGYKFTDQLQNGQHYIGSYTVKDAKGNTVATGRLDGSAKAFDYTFPANAGAQQYTIEYHTALIDANSTDKVNNHAEVTPPDENHPGGSDDGSYTPKGPEQPDDKNTYVTKDVDSSTAATDGKAEWTSLVKFSLMAANTDPTSVQFTDEKLEFDKASNADGSKDGGFGFDQTRKPELTIDGKTLTEGTDYSLDKYGTDAFKITFKSSDAIKAAIGKSDVQVKYWTVSDKTPGTYQNTAKVKYNGKTTSANAKYDIENTNLVNKTGSMKWVKDFDWSQIDPADTTKGAWVADWQVDVNKGDGGIGKVDTLGKPIVVTDTLPQGMSYVPGSGEYTVKAGNKPGSQKGKLDDVLSSVNGQLTFTIPTNNAVQQQDGSDKAYAKLTYQTAAKGSGSEVSFTNKAVADSGSTHFGEDSDTVSGSSKVIDKSAAQVKDLNRVRYTIKVNPEGADLIKDSDTVTLSDVMDPEGTFIPASLKIMDSNTGATLTVPAKVENVTVEGKPSSKLTLTLPDSTPVTVTYDVKPNGKPGDKVNLTNTVTLEGVVNGQDINKNDWEVTNPTSGTDGAAGSISITKADSADLSRYLSGAEFALYKVDMNRLSGNAVAFEQVQKASAQVGGNVTTDTSGHAQFGSTDQPLETNTLYYFVETKAPTFKADDGTVTEYKLDASPHYFMLPGTDDNEAAAALAKARGFGLPVSDSTSFNVYDERKPVAVKGSVTLGKQLTGRAWTDNDAFTFELAPDATNSKDVTADEVKAAMPKTTTTARKTGDGADGSISKFTFGDFTFSEPGTYAYTVKETSKGGNGVTVDTRTANVKFTVGRKATGALEIKGGQAEVSGITENHGDWTFENIYKPTETTVSNAIKVKKTLDGRSWRDGDSFEFRLQPAAPTEDAPLPAGATNGYAKLNVTDANEHAFGSITYTKAGEYHYTVFEYTPTGNNGEQALPGVDYSNALYNVTVTIKDDGNGKLSNDGVTMTKAQNDDGTAADNAVVKSNVAAVTNIFKPEEANFGLLVMKKYMDKTGSNPLINGKFSFTLTAKDGAPLPTSATGNSVVANVTKAGVASFPEIKLTSARDDGKTYTYILNENVPVGAVPSADGKTATLNGMTYDRTTYIVQVPVAMTTDKDGKQVLGYQVNVLDENGSKIDASKLDNGRPVFSNTYQLTPVETSIAG
ncbi:Spy0128 family protein [Bifidobacterium felsineum]|uniref:Spy0128 family protein n=1 Tax=Bifidobacterium felsineum TaxID=2045440 RepID=UPI001BDC7F5A|nr:FctA domain-containing protein [Bifidobacterium felsineum]